jgi:hypothetical protein
VDMERLADVVHRHVCEGRGVTLLPHQRSHLVTKTKDSNARCVKYLLTLHLQQPPRAAGVSALAATERSG